MRPVRRRCTMRRRSSATGGASTRPVSSAVSPLVLSSVHWSSFHFIFSSLFFFLIYLCIFSLTFIVFDFLSPRLSNFFLPCFFPSLFSFLLACFSLYLSLSYILCIFLASLSLCLWFLPHFIFFSLYFFFSSFSLSSSCCCSFSFGSIDHVLSAVTPLSSIKCPLLIQRVLRATAQQFPLLFFCPDLDFSFGPVVIQPKL